MATNITPPANTVLGFTDDISFDVDESGGAVTVQVFIVCTDAAAVVAYTGGAFEPAFTGTESVVGTTRSFNFHRTAGWNCGQFQIQIEEDDGVGGITTTSRTYLVTNNGFTYAPFMQPFDGGSNTAKSTNFGGLPIGDVSDIAVGETFIWTGSELDNGAPVANIEVQNEGVQLTPTVDSIDFVGAGVTATTVGDDVTVTVPGNPLEIEEEGVSLSTAVTKVNFVGAGVTATQPVADEITVTVPGISASDEGGQISPGIVELDFVGTGVTASSASDVITVNIPGLEVEDEGGSLSTAVTKLNFVGGGVTATEPTAGEIDVTVPSAAVAVEDEGVELTPAVTRVDFVGAGVTVTEPVADEVLVTIPGNPLEVEDEGISLSTAVTKIDFAGAGVTATEPVSGEILVTIPGGGGGSLEVEDEGVSLSTAVTKINFAGAGVTATEPVADEILVTIPGGGGGSAPTPHAVDANTVALWQFDGDLTDDDSGSLDLSAISTETYSVGLLHDVLALDCKYGRAQRTVHDASLAITGALTIQALVFRNSGGAEQVLCSFEAAGGAEADNVLYKIAFTGGDLIRYESENGAGSASNHPSTGFTVPIHEWFHIAVTRDGSGNINTYLNGTPISSGTTTSPTGGGNSQFHVGENEAGARILDGMIQSLKISDVELSAAQVLSSANSALGRA